ncbi:MAG: RecQ family ATP-dependent DNA helicase [Caldilineaceae bacterium]|nr:RecQ family ATP-dependent DNA helicase [Caldilineaceae bacterium]
MPNQDVPSASLLRAISLTPAQLADLPPETRDQLLDYIQTWESPDDQLRLVTALREAHGSWLFLLDYQARAQLAVGTASAAAEALATIERRQHRSTTIASQCMEARALLAAGHPSHARAVADDIGSAYLRHSLAQCTAAEIYAATGDFAKARATLEAFLALRSGDLEAELTLAELSYRAGEVALAGEYAERLGSGVPADTLDTSLQRLVRLHHLLNHEQSAAAVRLELERRRQIQAEALHTALAPFLALDPALVADPAQLYRHLNGPESIDVSREERRAIQLEAARHFGFARLREGQTEVIAAIRRHESILAVMPTGAGKSLCYQLPALIQEKPTLVISPLIALMKDQVESLPTAARRKATFINSTLDDDELEARLKDVAAGAYKLIYAAPERLRQRTFLRALRNAGLAFLVVDEAHCVSLWGHDFRPDYLFIQEARQELGSPPALAMTATAPPRVRDEIVEAISDTAVPGSIHAARPRVMALDIFRSNLHLSAFHFHNEDEKLAALLSFVTKTEGSGIIYVNSRHKSESLAYELRSRGVEAEAYHAGREDRGAVQDRFMSDQTRVVVATIAFGMGIDKPDIRFIVHFHPARSLAAYYQEVGRAGRDGKPSQGILFYSNNDWANFRRWAKSDEYTVEFLEKVYAAVATQLGVYADAAAPTVDEPVTGPVDIRRLQQVLNADETTLRVAVSMLERLDLLTRGFDVPQLLTLALPRQMPDAARHDRAFQRLHRGLALSGTREEEFKTSVIAEYMDWPLHEAEGRLLDWGAAGYLHVKSARRAMLITLPPRPAGMAERIERMLQNNTAVAQRRIDDVVGYATTEGCRHGYISAHFGSPPRTRCNVCDNCTGMRPDLPRSETVAPALPDDADLEAMILDCLISLPKRVGRRGLASVLAGSLRAPVTPDKARHHGRLKALGEATIQEYIDDMLEDGRLRQYESQGYPVLAPTLRGRAEAENWLAEHPDLASPAPAPPEPETDTGDDLPREGDKYTALQKAIWLWRRRLAEELNQPPYMIMGNDLILRIAETRPQSLEELAELPGIGAQRIEYYGPTLIDLIHLNPSQEGDAELLAAQRAAPRTPYTATPAAPAVSPQVERQIFLKLQELRQKKAVAGHTTPSLVATATLLKAIAHSAPMTFTALEAVPGFRSSGLAGESERVLAIVAQARAALPSA